jgi:archaellum component FlaF (FlaF/FlaG flagellin family)
MNTMKRISTVVLALVMAVAMSFSVLAAASESPSDKVITADNVTVKPTSTTYDGKKHTATVTVTLNGTALTKGTDYTVSGTSYKHAGTHTVTVKGTGKYEGKVTKTYTIARRGQTITFSPSSKTYKKSKSARTFTLKVSRRAVDTSAVSYTSNSKYVKLSSKKGSKGQNASVKVTLAKNAPRGTYKVTVKVSESKTDIKAGTKTFTIKVK